MPWWCLRVHSLARYDPSHDGRLPRCRGLARPTSGLGGQPRLLAPLLPSPPASPPRGDDRRARGQTRLTGRRGALARTNERSYSPRFSSPLRSRALRHPAPNALHLRTPAASASLAERGGASVASSGSEAVGSADAGAPGGKLVPAPYAAVIPGTVYSWSVDGNVGALGRSGSSSTPGPVKGLPVRRLGRRCGRRTKPGATSAEGRDTNRRSETGGGEGERWACACAGAQAVQAVRVSRPFFFPFFLSSSFRLAAARAG